MIAINDVGRNQLALMPALRAACERVLSSGWFVLGPEVRDFEAAFAAYCNSPHCITVANGTDALALSLIAVGVQQGDAVVTVANAGMYATTAIHACGAMPVFVDVDHNSMNMAPAAFENVLAMRPRAVIVTHLYGNMVDIAAIVSIAHKAGIAVIEDCAQAHGAHIDKQSAGTFGELGCFSFYPTKNLGALGDGGAIVTANNAYAERLRQLRQYGWASKYCVEVAGGRNSRLDELQAALLLAKLPSLDANNMRRREIADRYASGIRNAHIEVPKRGGDADVVHLFVVRSQYREQLALHMLSLGIQTDIHYPLPDHRQPAYAAQHATVALPVTERLCNEILTLPCHPALNEEEIARVIDACNQFSP